MILATGSRRDRSHSSGLLLLLSALFFLLCQGCSADDESEPVRPLSVSLRHESQAALSRALDWYLTVQEDDGSWRSDPAITALALHAISVEPGHPDESRFREAVDDGFDYLENFVREDGGIYGDQYRNYTTAVALLAFTSSGDPGYAGIIERARRFLIHFQCDESDGIYPDDPCYGGIGYGGDERPDLSNTQFALEAIEAAEEFRERYADLIDAESELGPELGGTVGREHWDKALVFLARCQNAAGINEMDYRTSDDGGFMYETGTYNEDRSHSYGSMTYAGVKSLLYADVDAGDERVVRAVEWIGDHYTVDENPGFGVVSLYYYYYTFAKCLGVLGDACPPEARNWRGDVTARLLELQHGDGYWVNENGRYQEHIPELATAYAVTALKRAATYEDGPPETGIKIGIVY